MNKKVFLACPYSQLCDEEYKMKERYVSFFKHLASVCNKNGWDYFLAAERESYGKDYSTPQESTLIDYETIREVDLVCAIPGNPISGGVHIELGWASALHKKIVLFLDKKYDYSPLITGLNAITQVLYYYYEESFSEELIKIISESLNKEG